MFLGILIGLMIWGILLLIVAWDDPYGYDTRLIGLLATLIGFCGSVGWIIEVLV